MFWAYILRSEVTGRLYTGSCENLDRGLRQHNSGYSAATRHGAPWVLIHSESFPTRAEAVRREMALKTGKGRDELKRLLD